MLHRTAPKHPSVCNVYEGREFLLLRPSKESDFNPHHQGLCSKAPLALVTQYGQIQEIVWEGKHNREN